MTQRFPTFVFPKKLVHKWNDTLLPVQRSLLTNGSDVCSSDLLVGKLRYEAGLANSAVATEKDLEQMVVVAIHVRSMMNWTWNEFWLRCFRTRQSLSSPQPGRLVPCPLVLVHCNRVPQLRWMPGMGYGRTYLVPVYLRYVVTWSVQSAESANCTVSRPFFHRSSVVILAMSSNPPTNYPYYGYRPIHTTSQSLGSTLPERERQRAQTRRQQQKNMRSYKVLLIGESGVGKSTLVARLCEDRFLAESRQHTLGKPVLQLIKTLSQD